MSSQRWVSRLALAGWILTLGAVSASAAQMSGLPEGPLSIDAAVAYGLRHNQGIRAAGEDVAAAGRQVAQSRAGFLPKLDATYEWKNRKDQPFVSLGGTGGSRFPADYTTTNRWQIDLNQPLFTGYALTSQLDIAELGLAGARYKEEGARLDLVRDIKHAFLQTLLAQKLLDVAKENVKSFELHRRNAELYYREGLTPKNDVLKAEVALAGAQQERRAAAQQVVVARARLDQLLGLELDTPLNLLDEVEATVRAVPPVGKMYTLAERNRPEVKMVRAALLQAEQQIRMARSGYLPHVSAFGQYYREGPDLLADENKFKNYDNATVGIRMSWNLFEGGKTGAKTQEYEYRRNALEDQLRELRLQFHLQVKQAYEQLALSKSNIQTARVALEQAKESERITELQYKEQLVIFLEVLNSQVSLLKSQVNYYHAIYGYALAMADLERSIGGPIPKKSN